MRHISRTFFGEIYDTVFLKKIKDALNNEYGDADCTLNYENPLELMIATQLAAQCTDARVNIVMKDLTKKYPDVYAYANADLEELMQDIHSTGFFQKQGQKHNCRL